MRGLRSVVLTVILLAGLAGCRNTGGHTSWSRRGEPPAVSVPPPAFSSVPVAPTPPVSGTLEPNPSGH
jgi:hypothetical protein